MDHGIVQEILELEKTRKKFDADGKRIDSRVSKIQIWGFVVSLVIVGVIIGISLLLDSTNDSLLPLAFVPPAILFGSSFGYGFRDDAYGKALDAKYSQEDLARKLIENALDAKIVQRTPGSFFSASHPPELTLKIGNAVYDYFVSVDKTTGRVDAYPKLQAESV